MLCERSKCAGVTLLSHRVSTPDSPSVPVWTLCVYDTCVSLSTSLHILQGTGHAFFDLFEG
jgi:hypothetical protein